MRNFGFLILVSIPLFTPSSANAAAFNTHGFEVSVEPVLAYEFFHRDTPTRHRAGMLLYGGRFTAGKPHFSLEGEYTSGTETAAYTTPSIQTVLTKKENIRIGARATANLSSLLSGFLRLGGQASRVTTTVTDSTPSSSTNERDWEYKPYLGAGVQVALAGFLSAGIDANYVFYSLNDFTRNSVQVSASLQIHFNSK
jgi:hypothetical protein